MILPLLFTLLIAEAGYGDSKEMKVTIKRVKGTEDAKEMKVTIKRVKGTEDAKEMKVIIKRVKGDDEGTDEGAEMTLTITREKEKAATDNEMMLTITREKAETATDNEMTLTITREEAKAAAGNEMTLTITREKEKAATDNEMILTIIREEAKAAADNEMTLTITREKAKTADNEMTLTITREKAKTADNEMTLTIIREKAKADNEMTLTITREKAGGEEPGVLEVVVTRKERKEPEKPKDNPEKPLLKAIGLSANHPSEGPIAGDTLAASVLGSPLFVEYRVYTNYVLVQDGRIVGGVDLSTAKKLSRGLVPKASGGRVDKEKHRIFAKKSAKMLGTSITANGITGFKDDGKIKMGKIHVTGPGYAVVNVEGLEVIEVPTTVDAPAERTVKDGTSYDMLLGSKMMLRPVVHYRVGDEKGSTSGFSGLEVKVNGDAVSATDKDKGGMVIVNAVKTTNARLTLTLKDEKGVVRFQKLIKFHVEKFDSDYEFLGSFKEKPIYQQWDDGKKISGQYYLPAGDVVVYRVKAEGGVKMVKYNVKWSDGSVTPFKFTDDNGLVSEKRVVFTGDYGTQSPVTMTAQLVRASGQGRLTYLNYRYQFQHTLDPTWPVVEEISFSPENQTLNFPMEQLQVTALVQPLVLTVKFKNGTEKGIVARSYLGNSGDYAKMLRDSPLEKYIEYNRSGSKGVGMHGKGLSPSHWHPPLDHHSRYKVGDSIPDGYYDLKEGEEGTAIFTATIETDEKAGLFVNGGKLTAKAEVVLHTTKPPSIREITADSPFLPGKDVTVFAEIDNLNTSISEAELNKRYEAIWMANPPLAGSLESERSPIIIESGKFIVRNKFRVSDTAKTLVDVGVNVGINIKLIEKEDREEQ